MKKIASATDPLWYKDAIIYELHIRAFADSNNDGIGDLPGLISKLDYLQDLGITCIWLLPFFPSPLRDDGYDISNYTDVNPSYGTLSDFKQFLDAAHQRNMQVMIELVINHTSDQHPWFKAARLAPAGSPEREMYVWSQTDQLYKNARIIFTDTEKSNWTWDETAQAYYWHRFFSHQPDLNWDNPRVMEEVLKAMRFWLDMGVDALRMDAIPYLVERDGTSCENLPDTHQVIKAIREAIDADYASRLILAEANQWPADVRPYFGDGDECHMAFHFPLMPRIYMALRQEDRLPITDIMAQTPPIPDSCQWGLFLRNHDELTLEMVTDDERDYMYFAYSADPRMRINVGIRRRLAPLVDNNRRRIELLNSLLLSFPGTPILYYGDEIGMGDNIYLGDRNGVRTPMQWTSDRNAGFSRCDPARLYFPVIMDPIYGYQVVNVEAQLSDQSSLLHWTRNMIALRKLFQVFGRGSLTFLNPANRKILAYLRDLEREDGTRETVLCVANLSRFAQPVSLDLSTYEGMEPVEMLGYVPFPPVTSAPYQLTLSPYSFLWLELQAPSQEVRTEPTLTIANEADGEEKTNSNPLEVAITGWAGIFTSSNLNQIEAALATWLPGRRWFGAKSRRIQAVRIMGWAELRVGSGSTDFDPIEPKEMPIPPAILLVEASYWEGTESQVYQVPLAISSGKFADEVNANFSESVVTTLASSSGKAVLHDATNLHDFRQLELSFIAQNKKAILMGVFSGEQTRADEGLASAKRKSDPNVWEELFQDSPQAVPDVPAPLPLDAQPGEAAPAPKELAPNSHTGGLSKNEPRESPGAVANKPFLSAHASAAFRKMNMELPSSSHVGSAEQSNTSIIYADKLILKLFRLLQPGENPDVEVGRFLTEVARFDRIAPFLGEITLADTTGEKTTLAMLQTLVPNEGDGWTWFLQRLQQFYEAASQIDAPNFFGASLEPTTSIPAEASAIAAGTLEAAALLGRRTAELHLALSCSADDPAFAPERSTHEDLVTDADQIEAQVRSTLEALKKNLSALEDDAADAAARLIAKRPVLMERSQSLKNVLVSGQRIRIHGDFHLGQTLRTQPDPSSGGDFVLLDFEGEPARPLSQRRRKQSPLRDVAGMLRSFSYAAYAGLEKYRLGITDRSPAFGGSRLSAWANAWEKYASSQFLREYLEKIGSSRELLPPLKESQILLEAFLLEKSLYELLYELNNRPTWIQIPIAGILSLCE